MAVIVLRNSSLRNNNKFFLRVFLSLLFVNALTQSSFAASAGNATQGGGQKSRSWFSWLWKPVVGAAGFAYYAAQNEKYNTKEAKDKSDDIEIYDGLEANIDNPKWLDIPDIVTVTPEDMEKYDWLCNYNAESPEEQERLGVQLAIEKKVKELVSPNNYIERFPLEDLLANYRHCFSLDDKIHAMVSRIIDANFLAEDGDSFKERIKKRNSPILDCYSRCVKEQQRNFYALSSEVEKAKAELDTHRSRAEMWNTSKKVGGGLAVGMTGLILLGFVPSNPNLAENVLFEQA